jgi:hypothetical protein
VFLRQGSILFNKGYKEKSVAKARLYLISTNEMEKILDRDMRQ